MHFQQVLSLQMLGMAHKKRTLQRHPFLCFHIAFFFSNLHLMWFNPGLTRIISKAGLGQMTQTNCELVKLVNWMTWPGFNADAKHEISKEKTSPDCLADFCKHLSVNQRLQVWALMNLPNLAYYTAQGSWDFIISFTAHRLKVCRTLGPTACSLE